MRPEEWREFLALQAPRAIAAGIVLLGALALWAILSRAGRRARMRFEAMLSRPDEAGPVPDEAETDLVRRRLTALRLAVNTGRYVLLFVTLLLILQQFNVQLGSLIFPAGFLGAALGLGAQNVVRDLVAGFFVVFEGQFSVGDSVAINNTVGTVEEVGLRVTRLRDEAGQVHFFPNGAINTVARFPRRASTLLLSVPVAEEAAREDAWRVTREAAADFDAVHDVLFGDIEPVSNANARRLELLLPVRPQRAGVVRDKLPGRVKAALEASEIKLKAGAEVEIASASAQSRSAQAALQ